MIKLIAKDINIRVLNTLIHCLEKLIRHKKLNMDEANLLRNLCLKRMNNSTTNTSTTITTNRSCQIQMLSMIVNTTYLGKDFYPSIAVPNNVLSNHSFFFFLYLPTIISLFHHTSWNNKF